MSTDRELLEMAAKAAGFECRYADALLGCEVWNADMEQSVFWHPLDQDGDALRLAVKLNLMIVVRPSDVRCNAWGSTNKRREFLTEGTDACAATRRAIVRAAAEIGKEMA